MKNKKINKIIYSIFKEDYFKTIYESRKKNKKENINENPLVISFIEINDFYKEHKREPNEQDFNEFELYHRLKSLRENSSKIDVLKKFDEYNLLKINDQ